MFSREIILTGQKVCCAHDESGSMSICLIGRLEFSMDNLPSGLDGLEGPAVPNTGTGDLEEGDFFGEMSLITETPHLVTVTATETSLIATISKTDYCNYIKVCPELDLLLRGNVQKKMLEKLYAYQIPFFSGLTLEKVAFHHPSLKYMFLHSLTIASA
jgi:CRP-like cAMP-binding protein